MFIMFFVSVSVLSSITTRRYIFRALFELCLFFKRLNDLHYLLERPVFPDVPVVLGMVLCLPVPTGL